MAPGDEGGGGVMHALIEQQLSDCYAAGVPADEATRRFIQAVNHAYLNADKEHARLAQALQESAVELTRRNTDLASQLEERQRAEQQLEGLLLLLGTTLDSSADGIVTLSQDGRIRRFNESFVQMWCIPDEILAFWRHDEVMAHILAQVAAPEEFLQTLCELIDHPETERSDILTCRDGRVFERRVRRQPLGVAGVGRVLSFRDISAQVRAEQEQKALLARLQEAQSQLLQSEKMAAIGQLAAGVAHEINNPIGFVSSNLSTMQGYVEGVFSLLAAYGEAEAYLVQQPQLLARLAQHKQEVDLEYLREDLASLLRESREGVARIRQIVQDLKDFSRPDQATWQWTDLHAGLDSTLNIVRNEVKYKAEVVREYGAMPPVECVAAQLNQVFMNLLINAAHAIEGQGEIRLRTGQADGQWVWVEIGDNGAGIAPEHLPHIFEPFFTTKAPGKGTGLGLSISHGIVRKHGGRIEVESEPGVGTRFRIWLPVNAAQNLAM
ncbi:MAG: ATP-binding protein [Gammaproteobacteria bacterium]|nr:ATP-binding protein [Gammaproteobacteria bacterium]